MPVKSGAKRMHSKPKQKEYTRLRRLLTRQQVLSRGKVIRRLKKLLRDEEVITPEVFDLVTLFDIQVDELTEAGVSYEMVKALETQYSLWRLN